MSMGQKKKNESPDITMAGTHLAEKNAANSVIKKVVTWVVAIAIIVFLVGMTAYNYLSDSGFFERNKVAASSENYSVTQPEMTFLFYNSIQTLEYQMQSYGMSASSIGLDMTKSLKSQESMYGGTWYDYFSSQAENSASQLLYLCEAAKAAGLELDSDDIKDIDKEIDTLEENVKNQGSTLKEYIKNNYGPSVSEKDIREVYKLQILASKYMQKISDEIDTSDEVLEGIYAADPQSYDKVSYLQYTFNYEDFMPEEEDSDETADTADTTADDTTAADTEAEPEEDPAAKSEAIEKIKGYAAELAEKKDVDSFNEYVKNYETSVLGKSEEDADKAITSAEHNKVGYSDSSEIIKWAFGAKVGDIDTSDVSDGDKVAVTLLTAERARDEEIATCDVRHILFKHDTYEDDTKAREVYDKWVADGAKVEDFEALAAEYSEDPGSSEKGGLYEHVERGQMVTEFNDWIFDENRVPGDHDIVETADIGWHIMYYVGGGETGWKHTITHELEEKAAEEADTKAKEEYSVNIDKDVMSSLA